MCMGDPCVSPRLLTDSLYYSSIEIVSSTEGRTNSGFGDGTSEGDA